jgi:hypothetical protein
MSHAIGRFSSVRTMLTSSLSVLLLGGQIAAGTPAQPASGLQLVGVTRDGVLLVSLADSSLQLPPNYAIQVVGTASTRVNARNLDGISGSGLQGISGSGLQGISGSGLQGISGSGLKGISGSGLKGISGSGLKGISGSGLQGISGSGLQGISGSGLQGISGSGLQGISGSGLQGISGSGLLGISGSGLLGISGSGLQGISGSGLRAVDESSQTENASGSPFGSDLIAVGPVTANLKTSLSVLGQQLLLDDSTVVLSVQDGALVRITDIVEGSYVAVLGTVLGSAVASAETILVLPTAYVDGSSPVYVRGIISRINSALALATVGGTEFDFSSSLGGFAVGNLAKGDLVEFFGTQVTGSKQTTHSSQVITTAAARLGSVTN